MDEKYIYLFNANKMCNFWLQNVLTDQSESSIPGSCEIYDDTNEVFYLWFNLIGSVRQAGSERYRVCSAGGNLMWIIILVPVSKSLVIWSWLSILYPGVFLLAGSLSLIFPHTMYIKQICNSGSSQNTCHASTAHYSPFDSSALTDTGHAGQISTYVIGWEINMRFPGM